MEREQLANPRKEGEEPYKPLAPVLDNSLTWGGFMGLSTNLRYQLVNGIEERALVNLPPTACGGPFHALVHSALPCAGLPGGQPASEGCHHLHPPLREHVCWGSAVGLVSRNPPSTSAPMLSSQPCAARPLVLASSLNSWA